MTSCGWGRTKGQRGYGGLSEASNSTQTYLTYLGAFLFLGVLDVFLESRGPSQTFTAFKDHQPQVFVCSDLSYSSLFKSLRGKLWVWVIACEFPEVWTRGSIFLTAGCTFSPVTPSGFHIPLSISGSLLFIAGGVVADLSTCAFWS